LRESLNLELEKDFDLKLAHIIAQDISQGTIIIDKGSKDLVQIGMPIITSEHALVGRINEIYDNYSQVALITAPNVSFDVKIGPEEIDGLAKGSGNNNIKVDLVPKDKKLIEGLTVSTSQLGGIFPAGLLVGTITQVNNSDVNTFQSAEITPAFDLHQLTQVFIANTKLPPAINLPETQKSNE